jgi:ABC-type lipoprotein release transport system permease subunit
MRAVWVRARADLRRRLLGWIALALLIGVAGGAAIAVAAAARRTDTAYQRFLASSSPSDASITDSKDFLTKDLDLDQVAALPEVERSARATFLFFLGHTADGRPLSQIDFQPLATTRGALGTSLDRWKVLEGRRFHPDKVDEVMLDYETARTLHLGVGDEMTLKFIRRSTFDQQIVSFIGGLPDRVAGTGTAGAIDQLPFPDEPEVTFHVVGIVTDPVTFPPIPGQLEPFLRLTPAFTERYGKGLTGNEVLFVDLADVSDLASFRSDVARLGGGASVFFGLTQADHEANVNRTLHLAAVVLWMLAGLIALAALLVSIQALSRQAFFESSDHPVLRALGMTRRERFATGVVRTTVIALLATVVAVIVAIALSPLWPIGLARVAEPSPGIDVNLAVVGIGLLAVFLGVLVTGAVTTWRWTRPASQRHHRGSATRPPLVARLFAGKLRPLPVVLGTRQALDGGRGRTAVPVRTTVMAAALAVATLTTALTFGSSLDHLLGSPRLYGWSWDAQVGGRGFPDVGAAMAHGLDANPDVKGYATGTITEIAVNGVRAEAFAMEAAGGGVAPALLAGRAPRNAKEIVLGTQTLRAADARIGDEVRVLIGNESRQFRVVGRAVFPDVGDIGQLGRGAYLTFDAVGGISGGAPHNVVLVKFAPAADRDAAVASLTHAVAPLPLTSAALPRDLASFGRVDGLPIAVAAILGIMAGAVLVYTLLTAIRRRRRDLAVLKALGFLRRDVARTVTVQALTLGALALALGLPIGVLLGRFVWRRFVDWQGIPSVPMVSILALALIGLAVLAAATLIAFVPARVAARTAPADALRAE